MNILDSLLVALGYEFDDDELKEFEESLDSVTDGINTLAIAAAGLVTAFAGATVASAAATDELTKQARRIGIATDELDAYNFAAEQTIGRSDGVAESLRQLSIRASEAARGTGSAIEAFGILGISVTDADGNLKDVTTLLGESADALNRLGNEGQRLELADKLGISELDLLIRQGADGIAVLTKEARELGTVTEEDGKVAEDFNDQINRLKRVLTATVRFVSTTVLPVFTDIAMNLQDWVQENNELIRSRLIQFLNAVTFAMRNFQLILTGILSLKFAVFILRMVAAYKALGAAALIANVKMFAIVIAVAAIIAAIGLLIEDFTVFQRGGESAIGALLEKFPLLNAEFEALGEGIRIARGWLTDFFGIFFNFLDEARAAATDVFEAIGNAIDSVVTGFSRAQAAVQNFFNRITAVFSRVKSIFDSVRSFLGDGVVATVNEVSSAIQQQPGLAFAGKPGFVPSSAFPVFPQQQTAANTNNSNVTNNNSNTININGGDINQVRRTVDEVINGKIEQASNNAQSPVMS